MRSPTFFSFAALLSLPFLTQKVSFPRKEMGSIPIVHIVSDGITPMRDEPEVYLLGWFLMGKRHGLGL